MGEPDEVWEKRIKLLEPYRVTKEMMEKLVTHVPSLNTV